MLQPRKLSARRRLIVCFIILAALFSISYINSRDTVAQVDNSPAVVGIARTPSIVPTDAQVEAAVREAVALVGGLPAEVGPGKKIVINPNLVEAGWPSSDVDSNVPYFRGVVTDVRVVRTIVNMCLEAGAEVENIIICEGAAGFREYTSRHIYSCRQATRKAFYDAGFDRDRNMIDDVTGVQLVDANYVREDVDDVYPAYPYGQNDGYNPNKVTKVQYANGSLVNRNYFIPNCIAECDVLIRVPVLKTHDLAGYTGALKLAFGIAPSDIYHASFGWDPCLDKMMKWNLLHQQAWNGLSELQVNSKGMVDMTMARVPDMTVIDGLVGVTTGPTRVIREDGDTVPKTADPYLCCIIASHDIVAADTVATLAIGYKINSVPGIGIAADQGLGQDHPGLIDIRGVSLYDLRQWWPKHPRNTKWPTGEPGNPDDPWVSDINLPNGAHVSGKLLVKPKAAMVPNQICKSEIYLDGELLSSALNSSSITCNIGSDVAEGAHTVSYVLYDMMLNKTTITRTVNVHNGNQISGILDQADGTTVAVGPVYMTGRATTVDAQTFFVSTMDGIGGLKAIRSGGAPSLETGYELGLNGTLGTVNGQRVINITYYSYTAINSIAAPRLFRNSDLGGAPIDGIGIDDGVGPYNLGCLVRTAGKVVAGGANYFYVNDGSLASGPAGADMLKVYSGSITQPVPGKHVRLAGWSCTENDGGVIRRMLILRSSADIATLN